MTREEWSVIAITLKKAYRKGSFLADEYELDLWYDYFADFDCEAVAKAARQVVATLKHAPVIAELLECVEEQKKYCRKERKYPSFPKVVCKVCGDTGNEVVTLAELARIPHFRQEYLQIVKRCGAEYVQKNGRQLYAIPCRNCRRSEYNTPYAQGAV